MAKSIPHLPGLSLPDRQSAESEDSGAQNRKPREKEAEKKDEKRKPRSKNKSKGKGKEKQAPKRPQLPQRSDTVHSRYVEMLLGQDDIPKFHNILASFFVWLLLAGFLVFPGTFTSLQKTIDKEKGKDPNLSDDAADAIVRGVKNIPLVVVGAVACGISAGGMVILASKHIRNYVWLLNRLFLPGATNSVAGLISTLVGVYTQQGGGWSVMAKVTAIVEGVCLAVCGVLFLLFNRYLLRRVKQTHGSFYDGARSEGHADEGFVEKMERKTKEPGLEPGSVV